MKVCDKCKKPSRYDVNIINRGAKLPSGLVSWNINVCETCMVELNEILEKYFEVPEDEKIGLQGECKMESSRSEWQEIWDKIINGEFDKILDSELIEWLKMIITE
ncbi:hypothetical protein LCGC14_0538660 [marine sediment metagenome]|uniref:Uncharacterized protein n=1 Tax=marine sediment metagenome TaxID=412755 RepID=A0A0F9UEZ1_9ZZZZ